MPQIIIENLHSKAIDCNNKKERLLDILLRSTDWMHACGGKGRCTTCRAIIDSGIDSLGPRSAAEQKYFDKGRLLHSERLTCQVEMGEEDIRVRVPDSSKLPHLNYSE